MEHRTTQKVRTVAVVGCGVIGMSWACLFLARGLKVIVSDPAEGAEDRFEKYLDAAWSTLDRSGSLKQSNAKNYEFVLDIVPRLPEADFIQEVIFSFVLALPQLLTASSIEWPRERTFQAGSVPNTRSTCQAWCSDCFILFRPTFLFIHRTMQRTKSHSCWSSI